jgi:hypothetical protein
MARRTTASSRTVPQDDADLQDDAVPEDHAVPQDDAVLPDVFLHDESDHAWRAWAAAALLQGVPLAETISTMVSRGVPEEQAAHICGRCFANPVFEAGRSISQQLRKLESILDMLQTMRSLSEVPRRVERRAGVSAREFLDDYYSQNIPVILEDVCDEWPALERWTPGYLVERLGREEVEVMAERDADPEYELNAATHRFRMPFDEYVAKITAVGRSNDRYLVANNNLLAQPAAEPLWADFTEDRRYLGNDHERKQTFLWFGPAGTVTPLHHDAVNLLFHQVRGLKRFVLVSPLETHRVYNSVGVFSDVDPVSPDLERFPRFAAAHPLTFDLGPGEALFVPAGWWHRVEALELSMSVSSTNFLRPNNVHWTNPERL